MEKFLDIGRRIGAWIWKHKIAASVMVLAALLLAVPVHFTFAITGEELFTRFATSPLDSVALILASIIQNITAAIGRFILLIIESIVIPILGYNGFYNSHITNLGWSLVRDVVNMFVVIVLLVIAIMTIVGYSHANWTQSLPRLFIAIVLVNFSKLICGLAIDISQVIMFTFVNAIVSIAAGNFASMLGLSNFGKFGYDFLGKINETGEGLQAFMFLGGAYLQFIIYIAILAVMLLLAIAFVWRIVVLWILIIMAPMAFFSWGIGDVFHSAKSAYSQWMSKFTSALTFGPILVFFLWLSLAASSGSTLAKTEDFPFPEEENSAGLELESFTPTNFLGMFLALAILIAGMQQAASTAKGMEGFASSVLSEKNGIAGAKWLAKSPFRAMGGFKNERAWANKQAKAAATATADFAPPGITKGIGSAISTVGSNAAKIKGLGWAGNAAAAVGGSMVKAAKDVQKEHVKHGADDFKSRTDEQISMLDVAAAQGKNAFTSLPEAEREAYMKNFGTDVKRREKFMKNLKTRGVSDADAKTMHDNMFKKSVKFLDTDDGKAVMDDAEKDRLQDSKFANLHLADPSKRQAIWDEQEKEGRLNLGLLSAESLKDADTPEKQGSASFLKTAKARRENGKDVTAWNDILVNGKGTQAQRDAMISTIGRGEVTNGATRRESIATLVKAGAVTTADVGGGTSRRDGVIETMKNATPEDIGRRTYGKAAAALLDEKDANGNQVSDTATVFGNNFARIGRNVSEDNVEYQKAGAMVEADSKSVRHLDGFIGETANSASQIATSKVNLEAVKKLQKAAEDEGVEGSSSAALKTMEKAVHAEINRSGITDEQRSKLQRVANELGTGHRYSRNGPAGGGGSGSGGGGSPGGSSGPTGPTGTSGTGSGTSGTGGGGGGGGGRGGGGGGGGTPAAGGGPGAGSPTPAAGGDGGGATVAGAAIAGAAAATVAQRFVARGRATMAGSATAAAAPEPDPAQQTAAQRFAARGRAAMAANAASAGSAEPASASEPTSAPEPGTTTPTLNSRPRSQVRTSSAPRPPDPYGSARRPNSAAPRTPAPYGSAVRPNSAAPRPSARYTSADSPEVVARRAGEAAATSGGLNAGNSVIRPGGAASRGGVGGPRAGV